MPSRGPPVPAGGLPVPAGGPPVLVRGPPVPARGPPVPAGGPPVAARGSYFSAGEPKCRSDDLHRPEDFFYLLKCLLCQARNALYRPLDNMCRT